MISGQSDCPEKEEREITQDKISGNRRSWEAIDNRLKYEERKTATREGVAVYKQVIIK